MRPFGVWHIAYLAGLGLAGWVSLVAATVLPFDVFVPWSPSWQLFGCLLLVAGADAQREQG